MINRKIVKDGFRKKKLETYVIDGMTYRKSNNRIIYDPKIHYNHGKRWTIMELAKLVQLKSEYTFSEIALMLGRTHDSCSEKYSKIKRNNEIEFYQKIKVA